MRSHKNILKTVAENVRFHRLEQNLTQEDLASKSKLHRTYIGSIEREERNLTVTSLDRIAQALSIATYKLLEPNQK